MLQLFQLHTIMKTNFTEEFVGAVIAEETVNFLKSRHLFKLDK